ncbi:MAG: nuclear transport factor 2 family protein [Pseudolysinimonas sp.]
MSGEAAEFSGETDAQTVQNWMDGYRRAWETNDPDDIVAIFTEDAVYRGRPGTPAWTGHDEIVAGWLKHSDPPGTTTFAWETQAHDGDLAVVRCVTTYPDGPKKGVYDNMWVIEFAPDGRAAEFTDWWIERG